MAINLSGKKLDGKRLGFIALTFSILFCASSLQVYRGERTEIKKRKAIAETFGRLPYTTREAAEIEILYYSGHGRALDKDFYDQFVRVTGKYETALAMLAHEFAHITKDEKKSSITLTFALSAAFSITRELNNSPDDYFYDRLLLEKLRQEGRLSSSKYGKEMRQLARVYVERARVIVEEMSDERSLVTKLKVADEQINQLQTQVDSLKGQLAQAERSQVEKWVPIIVAFLSLLIALSSNIIAWRTDRRQAREAELVPLKRQELEQGIIQKDQQIRERSGNIITPTAREIQLYSQAASIDNLDEGTVPALNRNQRPGG